MRIPSLLSFGRKAPSLLTRKARLGVEQLESRLVPYAVSGDMWPNQQLITISFVPDGTIVGASGGSYIYSNLFSVMNAKFGSTATWETEILRGAQLWAQQANINFAIVSDNGSQIGSGNYQQGDPNMGDIRISGYNFNAPTTLGKAMMPPPDNNYSIGGDIQLNTGAAWHIGSTYDLQTVAAHEIGHALGLDHSTYTNAAIMWASYTTSKRSLNADDVSGIQSIYGARPQDSYDATSSNGTFATASNINSTITSLTSLVTGLDITTTSDLDYYTFQAPSGTNTSFTVNVQSSGLSMLTPTLSVYDGSQNLISTVSGAGQYGTTLSLTVTGVASGNTYYVKVAGADTTAFSTGAYAMTLNFGSGSSPTVPLPNTQTLNGSPLNSGGGQAEVVSDMFPDVDQPAASTAASAPSATPTAVQVQPVAQASLHAAPVQPATTLAHVVASLIQVATNPTVAVANPTPFAVSTSSVAAPPGQVQTVTEVAANGLTTSVASTDGAGTVLSNTTATVEEDATPEALPASSSEGNAEAAILPQAADSCFADLSWLEAAPTTSGDDDSTLVADDVQMVLEPVAAFAGLTLLLAGCRGKREEERTYRRQRLGYVPVI